MKIKGIYCYIDKKDGGKIIKQSVYPSKLLEWFTKTYPNTILVLKL